MAGCAGIMAKTNAERQRAFRERQKEKVGLQEYRRRDAARKREQSKSEEYKAKHRLKMRAWGEKQKQQLNEPHTTTASSPKAYTRQSSMNRAMLRVKATLPKSPRKRKSVVKMLANEFGGTDVIDLHISKQSKVHPPNNSIDASVKENVINFYLRQDISWTSWFERLYFHQRKWQKSEY